MAIDDLLAQRRRPLIMGIVNVTPDSFSDGGAFLDPDRAVDHALALAGRGADIVDVGGESTRPPGIAYGAGASRVDADEEAARVVPVIERIHDELPDLAISVDTMKPSVAERALRAGATIVNDVSAGRFDEAIWDVARSAGATYVLMHGHDPAAVLPAHAFAYVDVVEEVHSFLAERIERIRERGVHAIVADVGIGFAKGATESERLLREHRRFLTLGVPMLVGASRKAFIGRLLGGAPPSERVVGSLAAHAVAAMNGAAIVRVHDVRETLQFLTVLEALAPQLRGR